MQILQQEQHQCARLACCSSAELRAQAVNVSYSLTPLRPLAKKVVTAQQLTLLGKSIEVELGCPNLVFAKPMRTNCVILDNLLWERHSLCTGTQRDRIALTQREDLLSIDVVDARPRNCARGAWTDIRTLLSWRCGCTGRGQELWHGAGNRHEFARALRGTVYRCWKTAGRPFSRHHSQRPLDRTITLMFRWILAMLLLQLAGCLFPAQGGHATSQLRAWWLRRSRHRPVRLRLFSCVIRMVCGRMKSLWSCRAN